MKILLVHSDQKMPARESIDLWRIIRPFNELKKHVDWQIDHKGYLLDNVPESGQLPLEEVVKQVEELGQYDIVWSSYFPDAVLFDIMQFTSEKFGTKFVLDMDDDMYHIPAHNNFKQKAKPGEIESLQYMAEQADYLVTSSEPLKAEYQKHRKKPTYLLPNYIGDDYSHKDFDNKDKVVIGFFGSITHSKDFEDSGIIPALEKLMKKYKSVHFATVGLEIKANFPKGRYHFYPGKPGQAWLDEVFPSMNIDISVAPLLDDKFNRCKTNIKWLESALIPSAFVASDIPPYATSVSNTEDGILVDNTEKAWYSALESLVLNENKRKELAQNAHDKVTKDWHIKNNWMVLKKIVEEIHRDSNNVTKTPLILTV